MSPTEFFYATQFDKDKDGKLNKAERQACLAALEAGYGQQFHHLKTSGPAPRPEFRVMQRRGVVLAEDKDGWDPLHATYKRDDVQAAHKFAPFAEAGKGGAADGLDPSDPRTLVTTMGVRTRSELLRARRQNDARALNAVGGDGADSSDAVSVSSFVNTKPFSATMFDGTVANRTQLMKQRAKERLRHVLEAQGRTSDAAG